VSNHCEFNSYTQITDNFFERCDGEAEVVSIKSCRNLIRNNLFKECQGSVVLRHGHFNTVENNVFLGNNKDGTGGVRVINRGQWVVNNVFYQCRGEGFRSPLSIMNGVPNSPAIRYVGVSNALIANNSFYDCAPFSLCEGSDAERSETPSKVQFINNIFYNTKDSLLYYKFDDISGISFTNNLVKTTIKQELVDGFVKSNLTTQKISTIALPISKNTEGGGILNDSFRTASKERLFYGLSAKAGYSDVNRFLEVEKNAYSACGALWFKAKMVNKTQKTITVNCKSVDEMSQAMDKNKEAKLLIYLTGKSYNFNTPLNITTDITLTTAQKTPINFISNNANAPFFIQLKAGKSLLLNHLKIELTSGEAKSFISTDTSGSCNHSNLAIYNCTINNSNGNLLFAAKTSVLDSIIINNCSFNNGKGVLFNFNEEKDKAGYYNVEKFKITSTSISSFKGQILPIMRSGKDESTMGPFLTFSNNVIINCATENDDPLFNIHGIQRTIFEKNIFGASNANKTLIRYEDTVRAAHLFRNNTLDKSGAVNANKFVRIENK
jgi:poly(beta-D-mannuronate) lyase